MKPLITALTLACLCVPQTASASEEETINSGDIAGIAFQLFEDILAQEVVSDLLENISAQTNESLDALYMADTFYDQLGVGSFESVPLLTWNGLDEHGDPTFIFHDTGFTYITSTGRRITPGRMDTDGGSIPQILRLHQKTSPWYYAPAFLIHDWLFVARKCGYSRDGDISFEEAALVFSEAMKTLTEIGFVNADGIRHVYPKSPEILYSMHVAVKSSIAKEYWDGRGNTVCREPY